MPISQKISQLTALALKDRVLTFTERQTIVNAALKEGCTEAEINLYLDNALKERLKNYTKEELQHCPFCGAQTPLISDNCLFCGNSLTNVDTKNVPPVYITGEEVDIINRENLNTAAQQRNLKTCPDCGAPFPLISNICASCGHILHEQTDSLTHINNLKTNIQNSITELKNSPKPSVLDVLKFRKPVVLFVLAAFLFVVDWSFMGIGVWAGFLFAVSVALLVMSFMQFRKPIDNQSPVKIADDHFYNALHSHEKYVRQTATLYGGNSEVEQLLKTLNSDIESIKQNRQKNRNIIALGLVGLLALTIILPMLAPSPKTNYEINRRDNADLYQMVETKSVIKPLPSQPVARDYKPFFTVESDGELSVDLLCFNTFIDYNSQEKPQFRLRLSNVKLHSTGRKITDTDTIGLAIAFWDKDLNRIGQDITPDISTVDYYNNCPDNIFSFLEKGSGTYYADFFTRDKITDAAQLRQIIETARYFTIY